METKKTSVLQEYSQSIANNLMSFFNFILSKEESGPISKDSLEIMVKTKFSETLNELTDIFVSNKKGMPDDLIQYVNENEAEYKSFVKGLLMQIIHQWLDDKNYIGHASLKESLNKIAQDETSQEPEKEKTDAEVNKDQVKEVQPDSLNEFTIEDRNMFTKEIDKIARRIEKVENEAFDDIKYVMTEIIKDKKYTVQDKLYVAHDMWQIAKKKLYDGNLLILIQELLQSWFPSDEFK